MQKLAAVVLTTIKITLKSASTEKDSLVTIERFGWYIGKVLKCSLILVLQSQNALLNSSIYFRVLTGKNIFLNAPF